MPAGNRPHPSLHTRRSPPPHSATPPRLRRSPPCTPGRAALLPPRLLEKFAFRAEKLHPTSAAAASCAPKCYICMKSVAAERHSRNGFVILRRNRSPDAPAQRPAPHGLPQKRSYGKTKDSGGGRRRVALRNPAVQPRGRGLRGRRGLQRRTGPYDASRALLAHPARRDDGRDERLPHGPAAQGQPRHGRRADYLLHGQGQRGRHGGGAQPRRRRLHHQARLHPRGAGPRQERAAPHGPARGGARDARLRPPAHGPAQCAARPARSRARSCA